MDKAAVTIVNWLAMPELVRLGQALQKRLHRVISGIAATVPFAEDNGAEAADAS